MGFDCDWVSGTGYRIVELTGALYGFRRAIPQDIQGLACKGRGSLTDFLDYWHESWNILPSFH